VAEATPRAQHGLHHALDVYGYCKVYCILTECTHLAVLTWYNVYTNTKVECHIQPYLCTCSTYDVGRSAPTGKRNGRTNVHRSQHSCGPAPRYPVPHRRPDAARRALLCTATHPHAEARGSHTGRALHTAALTGMLPALGSTFPISQHAARWLPSAARPSSRDSSQSPTRKPHSKPCYLLGCGLTLSLLPGPPAPLPPFAFQAPTVRVAHGMGRDHTRTPHLTARHACMPRTSQHAWMDTAHLSPAEAGASATKRWDATQTRRRCRRRVREDVR
jgi:hypothetical protein